MQREFQGSERTKRAARVAAVARFLSDDLLEQLPEPTRVGEKKVGGIDLNKSRMGRVGEAVLASSGSPAGLRLRNWPSRSARPAVNRAPIFEA